MAKKKIVIKWSNIATVHFNEILEYLHNESEQAVTIVGNAILDDIELLAHFPNANPLDRFKKNNDGSFRAFVVFNYRISYCTFANTVYILKIRHTSREPLEY